MADIESEKEQLNTLENLFQQKRFSDAFEVAKKASSDYPNSYQINFLYVRTLKKLNKLTEAEEVLKELMLIYPNNINLLLESGNLAVLGKKFDEAKEYYNKILFLDPFNTVAKNSIEKINMIKRDGLVRKGKGDFVSFQNEKFYSADTLPEFDSRKLRDIISEEPPPPPPPPVPEMSGISEEDTDKKKAPSLFQQKIQEQEIDEIEIPPPITNMEEMDSPINMESEKPETPPIPEYEIPPIPEVDKGLEEIGENAQKEHREPQTGETAESLSIPEAEPQEKNQEQEPSITITPSPIPEVPDFPDVLDVSDLSDGLGVSDVSDIPDIPDIPNIPEKPIEMKQVMESQEHGAKMEEEKEPRQEEPGIEETGFVTESAAELHLEQGLLDDALAIYKKLYDSRKEERFLSKIEKLKQIIVNQKKIQALNELLGHIKQRGEKIV